jgi:hypothetical protein
MADKEGFKEWAILELMGHRKLAGLVSEQELGGTNLIRIDVPTADGFATQFYGAAALYCLTPCSEAVARAFAKGAQPEPVHRWELPGIEPKHQVDIGDEFPDEEGMPF